MSAWLKDPLAVNTKDGRCWVLRGKTPGGRGLYALEGSPQGVEQELFLIGDLAAFGLRSMTPCLPMPVGSQSLGSSDGYPLALPWAALMDREDLTDFLDELAASAITHASSEVALAEVEKSCATWRLIAEAQHAHNTAPGPDAEADGVARVIEPTQALREPGTCDACGSRPEEWCPDCAACRKGCHGGNDGNPCTHPNAPWVKAEDVSPKVAELRALLAGQREAVDGEHYASVHHDYRPGLGRDLPPLRVPGCSCPEPGWGVCEWCSCTHCHEPRQATPQAGGA